MVTQSKEDYLKAIYTLGKGSGQVSTSALADHLGFGDGSVTAMLKQLSSRKLIVYTPYKGVQLTAAGKELALRMIRRHRLWEMFLVRYLGYRWDEIHDEAEQLEHATSDELDSRLDRLLGFPKFDPHGDPIPNKEGGFTTDEQAALTAFQSGDTVTIVRVLDDPDVLRRVTELGIRLNRNVTVKEKLSFDGSMKVRVGSSDHYVSREIAEAIFVKQSKTSPRKSANTRLTRNRGYEQE